MTAFEAKQVAEEMYKLLRKDIKKHIREAIDDVYNTPMNLDEAAEYLKIPKQTIYKNVSRIPHTKVGRRLRFLKKDLDAYINQLQYISI